MAQPGHVKKMARAGEAAQVGGADDCGMHSRYLNGVVIRPLRDGDTETVNAVFARLGDGSRRRRFGGAKRHLSKAELGVLARVDGDHHVLVAYVEDDRRPAGIARLVRQGQTAEVAFEVADECQGRGIGTALVRALAGDARAAGIVEFQATVAGDNPRAISLLSRCTRGLRGTWLGGERKLVAALD
jgi:ribosomal protein S18 acetylase RimI-like enzyme